MTARGIRNYNPGNVEMVRNPDRAAWHTDVYGRVGLESPSSDGTQRFARYSSMAGGVAAMAEVMQNYQANGINTIRGIISKYAPPGENNTTAYINSVSKELGIGPDDPLPSIKENPNIAKALIGAVSKVELGPQARLLDPETIDAGIQLANNPNAMAERNRAALAKYQTPSSPTDANNYGAFGFSARPTPPGSIPGIGAGSELGDRAQSAGMSFTPKLPAPMQMDVTDYGQPFGFSGIRPTMPAAAAGPGYDPLSSIRAPAPPPPSASPRALPGSSPDWGNAGPGLPAVSTPDYTTGSNGTFTKVAPSVMSAPSVPFGPQTGGGLAGASIRAPGSIPDVGPSMSIPALGTSAPRPLAGGTTIYSDTGKPSTAPITPYGFSNMVPSYKAAMDAVSNAQQKAQEEASAEMDREAARAKALSALPQDIPAPAPLSPAVAPPTPKPTVAARPIQRIARVNEDRTTREPDSYRTTDPISNFATQVGTPQQFMTADAANFSKNVGTLGSLPGVNKQKVDALAAQVNDPRVGIVAQNALQNEYAKATSQPQTKGLLSGFIGDVKQAFGAAPAPTPSAAQPVNTGMLSGLGSVFGFAPQQPFQQITDPAPAYNGIGASNSGAPMQGMYVQGADGNPTWANYSADQQRALDNSSGLWGSIQNAFGFGAGANNGWGPAGSMGTVTDTRSAGSALW